MLLDRNGPERIAVLLISSSGVECTVGRRVCLQVKITHKREREMRYRIDDAGCQLADQVKEHMTSLYCKYWTFQIL